MKKYFLMLVMLFTMSVYSFAEDNNATEIERIERYNVKVNTKKLANYLQLSTDQMDAVETVTIALQSDGRYTATTGNYLVGTYYIKETSAPSDYTLNENNYKIVISAETNGARITS